MLNGSASIEEKQNSRENASVEVQNLLAFLQYEP